MWSRSIDSASRARSRRRRPAFAPTDPQVAWFLSRFVSDVRSVSLDPVLMRQSWLSAYDFATKRGAIFLGDYARVADPFGHAGEKTVSVQVTSVVRASDRSFQVKWIETAYERGAQTGTSHWTAILTVVLAPPADADTLRRNPLGLYVDAIDWSRELDPAGANAAAPAQRARPGAPSLPLGSPLDPNLNQSQQSQTEDRP